MKFKIRGVRAFAFPSFESKKSRLVLLRELPLVWVLAGPYLELLVQVELVSLERRTLRSFPWPQAKQEKVWYTRLSIVN